MTDIGLICMSVFVCICVNLAQQINDNVYVHISRQEEHVSDVY